jgi:hypothetical protein
MKKLKVYLLYFLIAFTSFGQNRNEKGIWEIKPGDDYRAVLPQLRPGDELVFHEGIYEGNVIIRASGLPDKPILIRGYGNGEKRPVFLWEGRNAVLFQINGNNLILDYLEFRSKYAYATRIGASNSEGNIENVTIKNCVFFESGGGDISAYAPFDYYNINILNNYFIGPKTTPVYIGQHEGKVKITNFTFKGNVIDGSQIFGSETSIGYGIQLKLNVKGSLIENNYITNTKGPCIMVYGSEDSNPANVNIVRNNIVVGSRNSAGIVVGGGPSTIEGNLSFKCNGGISVQNYGGRNLLHLITLKNNTAVCDRNYGISFGNAEGLIAQNNNVITNNPEAFRNIPTNAQENTVVMASKELENLIDGELIYIIPEKNNLDKIWDRLSSGPLTHSDVEEIAQLILEHKISLKKYD